MNEIIQSGILLRLVCLLVVFSLTTASHAEDKKVSIRFLGGEKKVPLDSLNVTIRVYTGHWTDDHKKTLLKSKTDKDGVASLMLADGDYYVEIESTKELPYLQLPMDFKGVFVGGFFDRMIKVGDDTAFEFHQADACQLTLRAVDADTGKGIPGVSFLMESETLEYVLAVIGDNLGVDRQQQGKEVTDKNGDLVRYMAPWMGYTYIPWPTPDGYEYIGDWGATIPTPLGKEKVEYIFKFKKK